MSSKKAPRAQKAARKAAKEAERERKHSAAQIIAAARSGDCGTMERLFDGGLDVNAHAESGHKHPKTGQPIRTTALCVAVGAKQQAAARLLLDRGEATQEGEGEVGGRGGAG